MKKLLLLVVMFSFTQLFAQTESLDKLELKDGKIILGKVIKIKTTLVEFKENETSLLYEYEKGEIKYIQLASGKILTFEDSLSKETTKTEQQQQQPVIIKEEGTSTGIVILAVIGGVLGFLLLLGAIAGG